MKKHTLFLTDGLKRALQTTCGLSLLVAASLFSGCASATVPVSYIVPARLDMSGVKRIAIDSNDAGVTSFISQRLSTSGVFTVAPAAELQAWKQ
jgi:hypothetical protein